MARKAKVIELPLFVEHQCSRCAREAVGPTHGIPEGWRVVNGYLLCNDPECEWPNAG